MQKILKFVVNNAIKLVAASAFVLFVASQVNSCGNSAKMNQKMGELKALVTAHNVTIEQLNKDKEKLLETNKTIADSVKKLTDQSVETNKKLATNAQAIKDLKANRPSYIEECKPIVAYMQKEIDAITANFDLAIYDRDTWMQMAHNNKLGWQNETQARVKTEEAAGLIISDSKLKDEIIQDLQKSLKMKKLESTLFKGGTVTIIALLLIYGLAK